MELLKLPLYTGSYVWINPSHITHLFPYDLQEYMDGEYHWKITTRLFIGSSNDPFHIDCSCDEIIAAIADLDVKSAGGCKFFPEASPSDVKNKADEELL